LASSWRAIDTGATNIKAQASARVFEVVFMARIVGAAIRQGMCDWSLKPFLRVQHQLLNAGLISRHQT
ncbi:MAG TPA: hypothetical protein PLX09_13195, partial [Xanthomonadaceae bacterium]|nr:hypothetical protein [Xanthomonadaceae bacterium]